MKKIPYKQLPELTNINEKNIVHDFKGNVKDKIITVINMLSEIEAKDLDVCSVEDLAQLQYWLSKHQGSIYVKTIGRLAGIIEKIKQNTPLLD